MKALSVYAWGAVFESAICQTATAAVSLPLKRGTGYHRIAKGANGAATYGVWISLLYVALDAVPRGTLVFSDKSGVVAHDAASLALVTGFAEADVATAIERLLDVGWLVWTETATTPEPQSRKQDLAELIDSLGGKLTFRGTPLLEEWRAAVKGMKPSDVRRIFKDAVPGIQFPREFIRCSRGG